MEGEAGGQEGAAMCRSRSSAPSSSFDITYLRVCGCPRSVEAQL
jgi:hypothetical protein